MASLTTDSSRPADSDFTCLHGDAADAGFRSQTQSEPIGQSPPQRRLGATGSATRIQCLILYTEKPGSHGFLIKFKFDLGLVQVSHWHRDHGVRVRRAVISLSSHDTGRLPASARDSDAAAASIAARAEALTGTLAIMWPGQGLEPWPRRPVARELLVGRRDRWQFFRPRFKLVQVSSGRLRPGYAGPGPGI